MEKKGIGKVKRIVLHLLQHIMAVIAVICVAIINLNAVHVLEDGTGRTEVVMYPWETGEDFENSAIFDTYLRKNLFHVSRLSAIKNQLETNGQYDGRKKIDIYAYVNRKNDSQFTSDVPAVYYLEDLIKWNEYGFYFEEVAGEYGAGTGLLLEGEAASEEIVQEAEYWEAGNTVQESRIEIEEVQSSAADSAAVESSASKSYIVESTDSSDSSTKIKIQYTHEKLVERYQTVDGKTIEDLVSGYDEYLDYCEVLQAASSQLSVNYAEYKERNESYEAEHTNLRYCIQIPISGGYTYFTNDGKAAQTSDVTQLYRNYGKYLYYYPAHLEYETNTDIREEYIRNTLANYEYVFPEDSKIWIGVDTSYPVVDSLLQAKHQYENFRQYYILCFGILIASIVSYVVLWFYLTLKEGRPCKIGEIGEKQQIILNNFDRIPSELVLVMAGVIGTVTYAALWVAIHLVDNIWSETVFISLCSVIAFGVSFCAMSFYYSFVRRIKAHVFWKHTLIAIFLKGCFGLLKKGLHMMQRLIKAFYNDSTTILKSWLPYLLFLGVNAFFCVLGFVCLVDYLVIPGILILLLLLGIDLGIGIIRFRENQLRKSIVAGIEEITKGDLNYQIKTDKMYGDNLILAEAVNCIGEGIRIAVETSMKDERMKTDLITNVSHDIKTPLTSIINYVDLIKRENIQNEKIKGYIEVLDSKSQRLKQLTEDLVEASKISSGTIVYEFEQINFVELIHQTLGEYSERFEEKNLTVMAKFPEEPMMIQADSRRIWRVIENLYNNICKYAMPRTRVYLDMEKLVKEEKQYVSFAVKNISAQPLNINAEELTERFIRGDVSRSTEGSGLGLSIAKSLTKAQMGEFTIYLDGDLFKVIVEFPLTPFNDEEKE